MPVDFKMPKLGESVTEGTIGRWLKQPGDTLEQYEPMLEVTTDKVDTEVSAPINGTLLEVLAAEGDTVAVGTVIARLAEPSESSTTTDVSANGVGLAADTSHGPATTTLPAVTTVPFISPAVARLAAERNVDLKVVRGTGAGGRITKKDIEEFVTTQPAAPASVTPSVSPAAVSAAMPAAAPSPQIEAELQQTMEVGPRDDAEEQVLEAVQHDRQQEDQGHIVSAPPNAGSRSQSAPAISPGPDDELVPLSPMRRAIAEHMVRSKRTAPHVTTVMEADLSRITAHRSKHKADFERQGVKLTFTPYFVQAVVVALREVPIVNASFGDEGIVMHQRINVGMAVAIPDGLIVPVIKDADDKSLLGLSRAVNDLAERARTRRLQANDMQGGTFTITNHGVSGSLFAMPIINQPQSAILGVGAIQKRAVVISENGLDALAIRPMCYLSLTFDHRIIDGATADGFLAIVKKTLETYSG